MNQIVSISSKTGQNVDLLINKIDSMLVVPEQLRTKSRSNKGND